MEKSESSNSRNWGVLFRLFAKAIADEDDCRKIEALSKLATMSEHAPESILVRTVPMLLELLGSPYSNSNANVQEASACCLAYISSQGDMAHLIGHSDAIPRLVRLLPNSDGSFQMALLKCLRRVITYWIPNRVSLASHGGLETVLAMLETSSGEFKEILLEILSSLALVREVRKFLWNLRRVDLLVEAASHGCMSSRTRAAQAIGLLGLIKRACRALVDVGAVPVLMHLLTEGTATAQVVAGNSLGVISSHVDFIRPIAQAGAIPLYVELLCGSNLAGKEVAEDVLCVLAVNEENAVEIVENLVRSLRGGDARAKAAAIGVIWDLSSYKYSSPAVRNNSCVIPILVELLGDENFDVREKAAGAVAQMSQNKADRAVLANSGAIQRLISMLEAEDDVLRDDAAEALVNFSLDPSLGEQISCILENPLFQNMQLRVMQMRDADRHMEPSLQDPLTLNPAALSGIFH
ncbi:U-box domain-containing protein 13 [Salvia hispanica]|uniref:U-box domain-containing protein 13 n=1 Tax=Salvia hispanica TaxID=49212 RepID=UPI0020096422|nr:U-box domain-containing protein 13 [Salvia hispanica]